MHRLATAHVWAEDTILDILVEEDHPSAQMLLEDLPLYPDLEISGLQMRLENQCVTIVRTKNQASKLTRAPLPAKAFSLEKSLRPSSCGFPTANLAASPGPLPAEFPSPRQCEISGNRMDAEELAAKPKHRLVMPRLEELADFSSN
ncbi:hypothetical protein Aduo_008754 [Ancylostoma duodenale]